MFARQLTKRHFWRSSWKVVATVFRASKELIKRVPCEQQSAYASLALLLREDGNVGDAGGSPAGKAPCLPRCPVCSQVPLKDRLIHTPGRTHNSIRFARFVASRLLPSANRISITLSSSSLHCAKKRIQKLALTNHSSQLSGHKTFGTGQSTAACSARRFVEAKILIFSRDQLDAELTLAFPAS